MYIIASLLIGIVTFLLGLMLKIIPPKKINFYYGYRSVLSIKNNDTWTAGNNFTSKIYMLMGTILAVLGVIGYIGFKKLGFLVPLIALPFLFIISFFVTELYLKNIFDDDGNKKIR